MRILFENKIIQAFFALAVSISLWAYVISNSNPTYTTNVNITNIEYKGLDEVSKNGLYLIGDLPVSVNARVSGTRNLVTKTSSEYSASFDFSEINQPGDYIIRTKINVPAGVTVKRLSPEEINIRIDSGKTESFKTALILEGKHAEDFNVSLLTDSISVSGPASILALIARLEVRVNTDNLSGSEEMTYTAVAVDDYGRPIKDERLSFDEKVKVNIGFLKQVEIEVNSSFVPEYISDEYNVDISLSTETVRLKGDKTILDKTQKVNADLSSIQFNTSEKTQKVKLPLQLPNGVSVYDDSDSYVEAEIKYEVKKKQTEDEHSSEENQTEESKTEENNENQNQ